jgi:hypothetical protein
MALLLAKGALLSGAPFFDAPLKHHTAEAV